MNRDKKRLIVFLGHILEAIDRISRYSEKMDEAAFLGVDGSRCRHS